MHRNLGRCFCLVFSLCCFCCGFGDNDGISDLIKRHTNKKNCNVNHKTFCTTRTEPVRTVPPRSHRLSHSFWIIFCSLHWGFLLFLREIESCWEPRKIRVASLAVRCFFILGFVLVCGPWAFGFCIGGLCFWGVVLLVLWFDVVLCWFQPYLTTPIKLS